MDGFIYRAALFGVNEYFNPCGTEKQVKELFCKSDAAFIAFSIFQPRLGSSFSGLSSKIGAYRL
jgi:hypothetical protein